MSDQITRPIHNWAGSAPAADLADPGSAQELSGYGFEQLPPNQDHNYLFRELSATPRVYPSMSQAAELLPNFERGIVDHTHAGTSYNDFGLVWSVELGTAQPGNVVCCDHRRVYVGHNNGDVSAHDPVDGTELWKVTPPGTGTPNRRQFACDGEWLWGVRGNADIYRLDPADGSTQASDLTTFAAIESIYADNQALFLVGLDVDGTNNLLKLNRLTLAATDQALTDVIIHRDVAVQYIRTEDGTEFQGIVWVASDRKAGNAILSAYQYTDLANVAQSPGWVNANNDGAGIVVTPTMLVLGHGGATDDYNCVGLHNAPATGWAGTSLWEAQHVNADPMPTPVDMAWDGDNLVFVATVEDAVYGALQVHRIDNGALVHVRDLGTGIDARGVDSDGFQVYVAHEVQGGNQGLSCFTLNRPPTPVVRHGIGSVNTKWPKLLNF